MDGVVRDRIRMALNGQATVSIIIDEETARCPTPGELSGLPETGRRRAPARNIEGELAEFNAPMPAPSPMTTSWKRDPQDHPSGRHGGNRQSPR